MPDAFFDGYAGLKFTLPNGREVTRPCLPLPRAAYFLRLSEQNKAGDAEAKFAILQEFPKEVGLEAECNELTIAEFWEVFWTFFVLRQRQNGSTPPPIPTLPQPGMIS